MPTSGHKTSRDISVLAARRIWSAEAKLGIVAEMGSMHPAKATGAAGAFSGCLSSRHASGLPVPRQQFRNPAGWVVCQSREDVGEPGARIDAAKFAGFDQRINSGCALSASVRTAEGPIAASDGNAAHRTLGGVVRQADAAVVEDAHE